jgi:arsenate reductase
MTIAIYHNPRCSKSRKALELIREHGIEPEIVLYLETPPTAKELKKIVERLGIEPWQLIRFNEERARMLRLHESDKRSTQAWINILATYPELIERPIVIRNRKALICRPPEKVLELLA